MHNNFISLLLGGWGAKIGNKTLFCEKFHETFNRITKLNKDIRRRLQCWWRWADNKYYEM